MQTRNSKIARRKQSDARLRSRYYDRLLKSELPISYDEDQFQGEHQRT